MIAHAVGGPDVAREDTLAADAYLLPVVDECVARDDVAFDGRLEQQTHLIVGEDVPADRVLYARGRGRVVQVDADTVADEVVAPDLDDIHVLEADAVAGRAMAA